MRTRTKVDEEDDVSNGVVNSKISTTLLTISTIVDRDEVEINEEVNEGAVADGNEAAEENVEPLVEEEDHEQEEYERNIRIMEEEADDEQLWSGNGMQTMFTSDVDRDEMYNPLYPNGQRFPKDVEEESGHKRKSWLSGANENTLKFSRGERGESSDSSKSKHTVRRGWKGIGQAQLLQIPLVQRLSRCRTHISRWKRHNRNNAEEKIGMLRAFLMNENYVCIPIFNLSSLKPVT
ncbi:hypothetical protein HID58_042538 [Brassica napus]|uniref:Uncharacterized protein n=1 Tax=Brassica napus TaxID=3708 RepID=A0ABQ8BDY8_BRANA|nr:hypothetical protein HID58_042538 [Brassica napus]